MFNSLVDILLRERDINAVNGAKLWTNLMLRNLHTTSTPEANDIACIPARAVNNLTTFTEEVTQTLRH